MFFQDSLLTWLLHNMLQGQDGANNKSQSFDQVVEEAVTQVS